MARAIASRQRIIGLQEVAAWPPEYLAGRPGGYDPARGDGPPDRGRRSQRGGGAVRRPRRTRSATYSEVERGIADLLTAQVAIALLERGPARARGRLRRCADPLTGLLNRRFFDEAVETAYANARRAGSGAEPDRARPGPVLGGEQRARPCGRATRSCAASRGRSGRAAREGDVVVRYGGEEFVVIAPATDGDGAARAAEADPRVRRRLPPRSWSGVGRLVPLTISAGAASLVDESDGRSLFRAANSALLSRQSRRPGPRHEDPEPGSMRERTLAPSRAALDDEPANRGRRTVPAESGATEHVSERAPRCVSRARAGSIAGPRPAPRSVDDRCGTARA